MAGCNHYFNSRDDKGNPMSFLIHFDFYEWTGSDWKDGGRYGISADSVLGTSLWLDSETKYKAVPESYDGWVTPSAVEFFGCSKDISFVYVEKVGKGEIRSIDAPAEARAGDLLEIYVDIKNVGGTEAVFFVQCYEGETMLQEREAYLDPDQTLRDLRFWDLPMPNHTWNGRIDMIQRE